MLLGKDFCLFASFRGSRLTPERSSKSSDLGARIHSVPRSSRRHGARAREFKLERQFGERGRQAGVDPTVVSPAANLRQEHSFLIPNTKA
jgi:hypothetical protein